MILQTIQLARSRGHFDVLDITVKNQHEIGKVFAPTWDMVLDHKNYKKPEYGDVEYSNDYHRLMLWSWARENEYWMWLLGQQRVVLACMCKPHHFCHRQLLSKYLIKAANFLGHPPIDYRGEIT